MCLGDGRLEGLRMARKGFVTGIYSGSNMDLKAVYYRHLGRLCVGLAL